MIEDDNQFLEVTALGAVLGKLMIGQTMRRNI